MKRVYLDYAAATPVSKSVLQAMQPFFSDTFYNPSALYQEAREVRRALDAARSDTAQLLACRPTEVVFTAGGTESANLAIHGVMRQYPEAELLVSAVEHDAVMQPASHYHYKKIPVLPSGEVSVTETKKRITDTTVLLSVMYANNEIGTVQPIEELAQAVKSVRQDRQKRGIETPLYLHVDACQAPLYLDCNVARLGVDLLTLNGGKMHGPKQSGVLYVRSGIVLEPIISGGGQEWGLRQGTENIAFAAGFSQALREAQQDRKDRTKKVAELRDWFMNELESRFNCTVTGSKKHRIANNIHVIFPGSDNERVLFALDELGVAAAAGSACSASKETPSHVLLAIGKTPEEAQASIRFSLGQATSQNELEQTLSALAKALKA